jgi:urease accessory protein
MSATPPVAFRQTPDGVVMVASAGGPLGGDELRLDIVVGAGATLQVCTAAATIAQPALPAAPSHHYVNVRVAAGGSLVWSPEPLIVAAGAHHVMTLAIDLAADARIDWREHVVLGRHDEPAGTLTTRWNVVRGTAPLLRQEVTVGPEGGAGWNGPAVLGGYRVLTNHLVVGTIAQPGTWTSDDAEGAVLSLAHDSYLESVAARTSRAALAGPSATIEPSLATRA